MGAAALIKSAGDGCRLPQEAAVDYYFSADVETDGPIPGPFSMLSFALVFAGSYDGETFTSAPVDPPKFYRELRPISRTFEEEALRVNGLDREKLCINGMKPAQAMTEAAYWVNDICSNHGTPIFVAYPMSFDWVWLYWYFIRYSKIGSPFGYSHCYDIKTAYAVKSMSQISNSGRSRLPSHLSSSKSHTHHATDDAVEQAEIFAKIFTWRKK